MADKKRKAKFKVGQVVMLITGKIGGYPQPAVFREYRKDGAIVDFGGKGWGMPLVHLRPLTKRERGGE